MGSERNVDVVVIGAGPGGYTAAIRASQGGQKTVLIEREKRLGGICLLRGCIPTKALLETARRVDEMNRAADFGIDLSEKPRVDLDKVVRRKERVIARLAKGISGLCAQAGAEVVQGSASFVSPGEICVAHEDGSEETIRARHVILAAGSEVRNLPGMEADHVRILNSDSALNLTRLPRSLIVVGSGAVGLEFASAFQALGSAVTLIESQSRLLPGADEDVSGALERSMRRRRMGVLTGAAILEVQKASESGVTCRVRLSGESGEVRGLEAEALLVAVGRQANVGGLHLEAAGLELDRGHIPVGPDMQTRVKGIFAIGDLVNSPALAHVAVREAEIAVSAILGRPFQPLNADAVPFAVFSSPEAAWVGLTEKGACVRGIEPLVGTFPFVAVGRAVAANATEGFVKLVADRSTGRLVGAHIVGQHATELIAELTSAVTHSLCLADAARCIHAHPTLSEAIGEAVLVGMGRALGI